MSTIRNQLLKDEIRDSFAIALNNMPHGLCMFDCDRKLILCNAVYARMYDLPDHLIQPETSLDQILDYRHAIGNGPSSHETYYDVVSETIIRGSPACRNILLEDGRVVKITHNPLEDGGYVATHEDVTESVRADEQIKHMARHDPLTGLPNRTLLRERLDHEIAHCTADNGLAVLYLDLDHFKEVNDTFGHPVGDLLLKAVTARLKNCLRKDDVVARLGGDEFVIMQACVQAQEQTALLARRLVATLGKPFKIDGQTVQVGVSIGIAMAPHDSDTSEVLFRYADTSLYKAKSSGRSNFCFFDASMDADIHDRRKLECELRGALLAGQFEILYQPEINAHSKDVVGFEALLRWIHPERGLMMPVDFIGLAEETGMIVSIGEWVLHTACKDAATWPKDVRLAVNLSAFQFRSPTLAHAVVSALAESGLPASRLELEITESALLNDNLLALETLHHIKRLGVRITMDDFGTGYSSLSYLRLFPFDKIKIDQSFIRELGHAPDCEIIIKAVVAVGAKLGFTITAEGVETKEQFRLATKQGCADAQGFLFGRHLSKGDIDAFFLPDSESRQLS